MKNLKKVQYVVKLLPDMAHCLVANRAEMISAFKHRVLQDLLNDHPNLVYFEASFDITKVNSAELGECVEFFKTMSGRYLYEGNFVSREFLEKELSSIDSKIVLTAKIGEASL